MTFQKILAHITILLFIGITGLNILAYETHACSNVNLDNFIDELIDLSYFYEIVRYDRCSMPIFEEDIFNDALYSYEPELSEAFIQSYIDGYLLEANALRGITLYLETKYPDAPALIASALRQEIIGIWTLEDRLQGAPEPDYDPNDPPLFYIMNNNEFGNFQEFQFRLLGNMGEKGLLESIGLVEDYKDQFLLGPFWTWYEMGEPAIEILEKLEFEYLLPQEVLSAANIFIDIWESGRFHGLQRHFPVK